MNAMSPINAAAIKELAEHNDTARAFFDVLAERTKNSRETTVAHVMRKTGSPRKDVVDMFKSMEDIDLGGFLVGRRGQESRFVWHVRLTDVGRAAQGEYEEVERVSQNELDSSVDTEEDAVNDEHEDAHHTFLLRKGRQVNIALPVDLTAAEAARLAQFIQSLPM